MLYGLIFTIYGIVFMILLLFSVFIKITKFSIRNILYILVIFASILLALFETFSVLILIKDSSLVNLFNIIWNLRNVALFMYLYVFVLYYIELIIPTKYLFFKDYFIKNKAVIISFVCLICFSVFYALNIVPNNYSDNIMIYFGGKSTLTFLILAGVLAFGVIGVTFKFRKSRKNLFQCITLVVILLVCIFPFQIKLHAISLIPFALMFILYIFYYNIENPDIDLLDEVMALKSNINKSSSTKSDFLFNLSYDLVNPINTIVSLSDSISGMQELNKESLFEDVRNIKLAGSLLLDSMDNILNSAHNSGNNSLKEYYFYELIKKIKTIVNSRIGFKKVSFDVNLDDNISSKFYGEEEKIQKVLINILNNAVKYTEVGKIILTVTCTLNEDVQTLHFKISDTGCGIKDEEKSFIFASNSSDKNGVGLSLSKSYIESMNGSIRFESDYGVGTTFFVDIPQKISGSRLIKEDKENDNNESIIEYVDFSKYKVLIVDDDKIDIKVVKRLLEKYKLDISTLNSTLEFINKIKMGEIYDIVFLDHKMPGLDGIDTLKAIRQLEDYKLPKIVCLTANAVDGAREFYISNGFDDYLAKPVDMYEIDRIIKKFLK